LVWSVIVAKVRVNSKVEQGKLTALLGERTMAGYLTYPDIQGKSSHMEDASNIECGYTSKSAKSRQLCMHKY
jgi:hypothetical protein